MTIFDMLEQSGIVAMLGMGIVFSFLVILVVAITWTSKIIRKFAAEEEIPAYKPALIPGDDGIITAVICAAVNEYRKNK